DSHAEIRNGIAPEIGPEIIIAALARGFESVVLKAVEFAAGREQMIAKLAAVHHAMTEAVNSAVDRNRRAGAEALVGSPDPDLRADRIGLGHQQRMNPIEADR